MSRPRERESGKGLLPRMEAYPWKDGETISYRYHPVGGKPIALGTDRAAAIRKVLDLTGKRDTHGTLEWLWEQIQTDAKWLKLTEGTRADYGTAWRQIGPVLGGMHASAVTSNIVATYVHDERKDSPRRADIEKSLLSKLFKLGVRKGACSSNPAKEVEPHGSEARTEAPKTDVLGAFLRWLETQAPQRRIIGMAAEFASLVGSRQVEFLPLTWMQVDEAAGVMRLVRGKQRGRKRERIIEVVEITPAVTDLLGRLKALRAERGVDCTVLFPTNGNNAYTSRGFRTAWQRAVNAAMDAKVFGRSARFTFHDLRAYYATMHKRATGELPDLHKDPSTTARVYDRNEEVKRRAL